MASAVTATTRGGEMFLSPERDKDSVVSGLEQCSGHGGALPEGSYELLLWLLPSSFQKG